MSYIETEKAVITHLPRITQVLVKNIMSYIKFPEYELLFTYDKTPKDKYMSRVSIPDKVKDKAESNSYIFNKKKNYILYLDKLIVTPEKRRYIFQKIKECQPKYENTHSPRIYMTFWGYVYEIDTNYIKFIPKKYQTPRKCIHAFDYHCSNIQYIPKSNITHEMACYAFEVNIENFKFIPNCFKTQTMCEIAINYNPQFLLKDIPKKFITDAMCINIVNIDGNLFRLKDYDSNYLNQIISSDHLRRKFIRDHEN